MIQITNVGPVTQLKMSRQILGRPLRFTAAYYVDGLLIDTGFDHGACELAAILRDKPLQQIVHTHSHEDHVGGNFLLQHHRGVTAQAHPNAIPVIHHPPQNLKFHRRFVWGVPKPASVEPLDRKLKTDHYCFQVLYLPGHSNDHVGFYEPNQGWLFGGDLFLGVKVRVLGKGEQFHPLLDSLRKVVQMPMEYYFCGGGKILTDPTLHLKLKLEFYEEIQDQIWRLYQKGWDKKRIRDQVLGKEGLLTFISQGEFSKLSLVRSVLGEEGTDSPPTATSRAGDHT